MARNKAKDLESELEGHVTKSDKKFRSYKNEGFEEFVEGEEIEGTLISLRDHSMANKRSKIPGDMKEVRVYNIRKDDGTLIRLAGRTMLDRMVDDAMDEQGGFTVDNRRYSGKGYDWLINRTVRFIRGEDSKTNDGNQLGTYQVLVEED